MQLPEPVLEFELAGHEVHDEDDAFEYVPWEHSEQAVELPEPYVPAAHGWQVVETPSTKYVPFPQHSWVPFAMQCALLPLAQVAEHWATAPEDIT